MRKEGASFLVGLLVVAQLAILFSVPEGVSAYTPHAPIYITGNSGFNSTNGVVSGNGTPSDPYIIEGWEINATIANAIHITNTDAHFVVRDVYIYAWSNPTGRQYDGIHFMNVKNGAIRNSTIENNSNNINVWYSDNIAITGNSLSNYQLNGLTVYQSTNVTVTDDNDISGNSMGPCIGITYSTYLEISGNLLVSCDDGINAYTLQDSEISGNTILSTDRGIVAMTSEDLLIKGNLVNLTTTVGILMQYPVNVTIEANHLSSMTTPGVGIQLVEPLTVTVLDNDILNNYQGIYVVSTGNQTLYTSIIANNITTNTWGVYLDQTMGMSVYHNNFFNNTNQAYDNMSWLNDWDNGCPSGGNYWSDYNGSDINDCLTGKPPCDGIGDTPYVIDPDSQDDYPLMHPWPYNVTNEPPYAPWPLSVDGVSVNDSQMFHITKSTNFPLAWTHNDSDGDPQLQAYLYVNDTSGPVWTKIVQGSSQSVTFDGSLQSCKEYWFAARTKDAYDLGAWAVLKFHTNCMPTGLANLAPSNNATLRPSPDQRVYWTFANDSDPGDSINYTWKVATDPQFTNIISTGTTVNNYSDPFQTYDQVIYYWCVYASDGWQDTQCTPTWNFAAIQPGPPTIAMVRPLGGEYYTGGSTLQVEWMAYDFETPLSGLVFYVNYTSSVSSGSIAGPVQGVTTVPWVLPMIDATDVVVNITAIDADAMKGWNESGPFTIDSTPPSLSLYSPMGWNVPMDAIVDAFFDEPVSAMLNYTYGSFGLQDMDTSGWVAVTWVRVPPSALFLQEFHFVPDAPLKLCGNYHAFINDTFFDRAGHLLSNPTDWTFHTICPPTLTLLTSLSAKDWSGGSTHDVMWKMGDEFDPHLNVWLNLSVNGGADGYPIMIHNAIMSVGTVRYPMTLPLLNTSVARLKVTVLDSSGLSASEESGRFIIDSKPPSILASVPSGGSTGVKITDHIQIVFDEAIVRSSAEQAFSISPNPGGIEFSWSKTTSGKDILVVGHKPMKSRTDYTVSFSTVLRDDSDPGNHPDAPLTFSFSTKPPPDVDPPVAKAVGHNQVPVGEPITLDGSGSTGEITRYVWTITDNQDWIVDVLEGEIVTYTFQKTGRYAVTLRVTDGLTGMSDEDTLEIVVTSNPDYTPLILFMSAFFVMWAILGVETTRVSLLTILLAGINRRRFSRKEDHVGRGMVLGYIVLNPGDTYTDIKRNLDLNDGTLTWHLMKLEKDEQIHSKTEGTRKRYYPINVPPPVENGGELHAVQKRLLHAIEGDPGKPVRIIAEELGISSQLTLYHLRKLHQRGFLILERRGLQLRACLPENKNS